MKTYKLNRDWTIFSKGELFEKADDDRVLCTPVSNEDVLVRIPDEYLDEQNHVWRPNEDGAYHYIDSDGIVLNEEYYVENDHTDKGRLAIGNCFKTAQEANNVADWLKARQRLIESGARFINSRDIDASKNCFNVYFSVNEGDLMINDVFLGEHVVFSRELCFDDKQLVERSIEEHKDDWLVYLGVEEKSGEEE